MLVRPQSANARRSLAIIRLTSLKERSRSSSTRTCRELPSERPGLCLAETRISGTLDCCSLAARRPAHHRPASARAVLVEDLLRGQQRPKALQLLLDAHIYLRLNRGFKHRALYARRPAHYGTARGGAILANNLFGTEQGPQALQALPSVHTLHTSISYLLTFILYVYYHRSCACQVCASASKPSYIALDRTSFGNSSSVRRIRASNFGEQYFRTLE
jgi:hypothetical protein